MGVLTAMFKSCTLSFSGRNGDWIAGDGREDGAGGSGDMKDEEDR